MDQIIISFNIFQLQKNPLIEVLWKILENLDLCGIKFDHKLPKHSRASYTFWVKNE